MNKYLYLFVYLMFNFSAYAETEIQFSLSSDSIWRGLTQNNGEPTLGADINFSLDNGFVSGAWIESCCSETSSYPTREIGFYAGYEKSFSENIAFSFNYVGTNYPNSKIDNYDEIEFNFSFHGFEISYFKGLNDFPDYYEFSYSYNFFDNSLNFSFGDFDSYKNINSSNGSNYSIGIETLQNKFYLNFYYYYFNSNGTSDLNDDGFVFSITRKTIF